MLEENKTRRYLFWGRVLNPIIWVVYGILCFYGYSLSQYGNIKRKFPIIIACFLVLVIWFLWCFLSKTKENKFAIENGQELEFSEEEVCFQRIVKRRKLFYYIGCFAFIGMTIVTGIKIYNSSVNFNGKLAWFIHDLKNKRQVEFRQDNIYEYGLEGIFNAIESKIEMPEELYVSDDFKLSFEQDGRIISFDTYLYGKNENGETESFLIIYDHNRTNKITINLNGFVNDDYDQIHKIQPLFDMMQAIPIEEAVSNWNQKEYGVLYSGIRNWGYNTDGIVYLDKEGNTQLAKDPMNEILGYTVSVYVPGQEGIFIPVRFIATWLKATITPQDEHNEKEIEVGCMYIDGEEAFFLDKTHGYWLQVVDAALGSRFYALLETQDSGVTWETINTDPYMGNTGVSAGITFIDEKLGFIGLSHSGGSYGNLYRTEDGGLSFEECVIPSIEVPLTANEIYSPFDLPHMPYEEDGKLKILVGQGQDGDYNGGAKAMFQSVDNGITWEYIKEVL